MHGREKKSSKKNKTEQTTVNWDEYLDSSTSLEQILHPKTHALRKGLLEFVKQALTDSPIFKYSMDTVIDLVIYSLGDTKNNGIPELACKVGVLTCVRSSQLFKGVTAGLLQLTETSAMSKNQSQHTAAITALGAIYVSSEEVTSKECETFLSNVIVPAIDNIAQAVFKATNLISSSDSIPEENLDMLPTLLDVWVAVMLFVTPDYIEANAEKVYQILFELLDVNKLELKKKVIDALLNLLDLNSRNKKIVTLPLDELNSKLGQLHKELDANYLSNIFEMIKENDYSTEVPWITLQGGCLSFHNRNYETHVHVKQKLSVKKGCAVTGWGSVIALTFYLNQLGPLIEKSASTRGIYHKTVIAILSRHPASQPFIEHNKNLDEKGEWANPRPTEPVRHQYEKQKERRLRQDPNNNQ